MTILALTYLLACSGPDTNDSASPVDTGDDSGQDTNDTEDTETSCERHDTRGCSGGDVYWYDSCGEREDRAQNCGSDEECVEDGDDASCEDSCTANDEKGCYQGDVYWYDSCGVRGARADDCTSTEECVEDGDDASCESACEPNVETTCYSGDVYYVDSCGVRGTKKEDCSAECVDAGAAAYCVDVDLQCKDTDHECVNDYLDVDFACTIENDSKVAVKVDRVTLTVASSDLSSLREWDDDTWSGGDTVAAGGELVLDDGFNVEFDSRIDDDRITLNADITITVGGVSTTLDATDDLVVLNGWLSACD